jgi:hypothetical protein
MNDQARGKEVRYTRTPMAQRLPTVGSLALALLLASRVGHTLWLRLLVFVGTLVVCILVLHFVFRQPIQRLLGYQEYGDE